AEDQALDDQVKIFAVRDYLQIFGNLNVNRDIAGAFEHGDIGIEKVLWRGLAVLGFELGQHLFRAVAHVTQFDDMPDHLTHLIGIFRTLFQERAGFSIQAVRIRIVKDHVQVPHDRLEGGAQFVGGEDKKFPFPGQLMPEVLFDLAQFGDIEQGIDPPRRSGDHVQDHVDIPDTAPAVLEPELVMPGQGTSVLPDQIVELHHHPEVVPDNEGQQGEHLAEFLPGVADQFLKFGVDKEDGQVVIHDSHGGARALEDSTVQGLGLDQALFCASPVLLDIQGRANGIQHPFLLLVEIHVREAPERRFLGLVEDKDPVETRKEEDLLDPGIQAGYLQRPLLFLHLPQADKHHAETRTTDILYTREVEYNLKAAGVDELPQHSIQFGGRVGVQPSRQVHDVSSVCFFLADLQNRGHYRLIHSRYYIIVRKKIGNGTVPVLIPRITDLSRAVTAIPRTSRPLPPDRIIHWTAGAGSATNFGCKLSYPFFPAGNHRSFPSFYTP